MGIEGYTGSKTDEQQMREEQEWRNKTQWLEDILESNEIQEHHKENYELTGLLIEKHLGNFLKKQNITNGLMLSVDEYEEELIKVYSDAPDKNEEFLEAEKGGLISAVSRNFNNMDIPISDEERKGFVAGILSFVEELKQKLLEKHGLTDLGNNK